MSRAVRVPGLTVEQDQEIMVRAQVTGIDPTTVRIRAWVAGDPEPSDWPMTTIDWAGVLQGSGAVGLGGYLGATSSTVPVILRFDDLSIVEPD